MSVGNIGPGSDPSRFPGEKDNSQESSSSSKKTGKLWSKIKGSSQNVENKTTSSTTRRKIIPGPSSSQKPLSRGERLENLEEKTKNLSSSAAGFSETTGKLEEKYRNRTSGSLGFLSSLKETFQKTYTSSPKGLQESTSSKKASDKPSNKTTRRKIIPGPSSSQKPLSRGERLENLEEKTKNLSSSAADFSETARKLQEKYKKQAEKKVSEDVHRSRRRSRGFLSFIKGKLQISGKQEESSLSSTFFEEPTSSEEVGNALEELEKLESGVKDDAETVESVNSCLDDCCGCLKKLKSLFKHETHTRERSKGSCCEKFKKSLLKIKEDIKETTESINKAIKKRMRLNSVSFQQQVYKKVIRKLLETSGLEERASVALFGIKALARTTGFDCKVNKNGLSFVPKSDENLFFSRMQLFSKLVDEFALEIDEIDPQTIESEDLQKHFDLAVKDLSNYSNYFWHLFGLFY